MSDPFEEPGTHECEPPVEPALVWECPLCLRNWTHTDTLTEPAHWWPITRREAARLIREGRDG